MPVSDLERGFTQRGAQPGMVAVAQPRFDGHESSPGLLVLLVGHTMERGGDGRVAVCASRQGQAQERTVHIGHDPGDPGRGQDVGEQAACVAGFGVDEVDETKVLPHTV